MKRATRDEPRVGASPFYTFILPSEELQHIGGRLGRHPPGCTGGILRVRVGAWTKVLKLTKAFWRCFR
jgi:hypothetical protein